MVPANRPATLPTILTAFTYPFSNFKSFTVASLSTFANRPTPLVESLLTYNPRIVFPCPSKVPAKVTGVHSFSGAASPAVQSSFKSILFANLIVLPARYSFPLLQRILIAKSSSGVVILSSLISSSRRTVLLTK